MKVQDCIFWTMWYIFFLGPSPGPAGPSPSPYGPGPSPFGPGPSPFPSPFGPGPSPVPAPGFHSCSFSECATEWAACGNSCAQDFAQLLQVWWHTVCSCCTLFSQNPFLLHAIALFVSTFKHSFIWKNGSSNLVECIDVPMNEWGNKSCVRNTAGMRTSVVFIVHEVHWIVVPRTPDRNSKH